MRQVGADCIKVHDGLDANLYPVVIQEARNLGLPVVGHVPRGLLAGEVSAAGQASIEHMFGIAGPHEDFFRTGAIRPPDERITSAMRELFAILVRNKTG